MWEIEFQPSSDGDNEAIGHKIASDEKTDRTTKV